MAARYIAIEVGFEIIRDTFPVSIPGFEEEDLFCYYNEENCIWSVTEGTSGFSLAKSNSKARAIQKAYETLSENKERLKAIVDKAIERHGRCPLPKETKPAVLFSKRKIILEDE